jgi:hypothetical protein
MARLAALILVAVAAAGITAIGTTAHDSGSVSVTADGTTTPNGGGGPNGGGSNPNGGGCPSCV